MSADYMGVSPAVSPLIDIGANLSHESYRHDIEAVLVRAMQAGVTQLILTGTDPVTIADSLALIARFDQHPQIPTLHATAGLHPHQADEWTPAFEHQLREALKQQAVVAVGECGLDYYRDLTPRPLQKRVFEAQLTLAAEQQRPIFLHERDASTDMLDILGQWRNELPQAVVHCFTGDKSTLYRYLDLDLHIGITGWICDERRGRHLHPLVSDIPLHRLMVETDCPYLLPRDLPRPVKTRRHEPALLPWICRTLARLRDTTEVELAQGTTATATAFFGLSNQPNPW